jgi:A/G-specific adenine glycosylase
LLPSFFAEKLLVWHLGNPREMPWLESKDPYIIWISEIILQQTRVAQGWDYFQRFILRFPDVFSIYEAEESEVFTYWEGLGYYTRVRNIIKTATILVEKNNGIFPDTYEGLLNLPGIGSYTASAIAGFAYNLPYPVIDGNVIRLISRISGITTVPTDKKNIGFIHSFLKESISLSKPSRFNQAIMNFGALVCKPASPLCHQCTFQSSCFAFQQNLVDTIPVKREKAKKITRYFHYFIIKDSFLNKTVLQQRTQIDIWRMLYQFPLIESGENTLLSFERIREHFTNLKCDIMNATLMETEVFQQKLTHQTIYFTFYKINGIIKSISDPEDYITVNISDLSKYAMPVSLKKSSKWLES